MQNVVVTRPSHIVGYVDLLGKSGGTFWYRETRQEDPMDKRERRTFTEEFKQESVRLTETKPPPRIINL